MRKIFIILIFVFIAGCSPLQHITLSKPEIKKFENIKYDNFTLVKNWYEYLNDGELNKLIKKTLNNNVNIKIALKNIEIASKNIAERKAFLYPTVNIAASRRENKQHLHDLPSFIPSVVKSRIYNTNVSASYEIDFWNKYGNLVKNAEHLKSINYYIFKNIKQTVVTSLVRSYYNVKFLKKKLESMNSVLELLNREKQISKARYGKGIAEITQVYNTESLINGEKALITILKASIAKNRYTVNVLSGYLPEKNLKINSEPININLLRIPSNTTSQVLLRRPDINLAIEKIKAQANIISSKKAELLPVFKLTGNYGFENEDLKSLIRNSSSLYSWIGDIFMNIFDFGLRKTRIKKEELKFQRLKLEYFNKVLEVLKNVETALINFSSLKKRNRYLKNKLNILENIISLKKNDYIKGIADITELFKLKREKENLKIEILDNENQIYSSYIKCLKEMGY